MSGSSPVVEGLTWTPNSPPATAELDRSKDTGLNFLRDMTSALWTIQGNKECSTGDSAFCLRLFKDYYQGLLIPLLIHGDAPPALQSQTSSKKWPSAVTRELHVCNTRHCKGLQASLQRHVKIHSRCAVGPSLQRSQD